MTQLEQLLRDVAVVGRHGDCGNVGGVHYDSRRIEPGWAFVAIRGEVSDGNDFVPQALARGASVVISERQAPEEHAVAWVQVREARAALAQVSANWFSRPGGQLHLVGVTGTNGKTTTTFLIEALLRHAGWRTGLIGTIETHIGDQILTSPHTTPESYDLQRLLADMVRERCEATVMEVSSHALAMDRVWGLRYAVAVFTNLTQDHLDFHHTMAAYEDAKRRLFTGVGAPPPLVAVINADDPAGSRMVAGYRGKVIAYGFSAAADLRAERLENHPSGLRFQLRAGDLRRPVVSPLLGRVNASNLMAAIGAGLGLGLPLETAIAGVCSLARVRGRFERVYGGQPFTVAVDYAHTPDALANVLGLARELAGAARVLAVFGCGGDRDRAKRPRMGAIAAQAADWVMVTSDNPRSEDPEAILDEICAAAPGARRTADRRVAIAAALSEARSGDIVVIAGKGHEDYQIIGNERRHFDDAEEARAALGSLGWKG